jgi:uncharacterized membrane protein YeaQ/YmgE (transglycosylase-associated protein family)
VLILGILGFGVLIGWTAQLLLGRRGARLNWGVAILAGIVGSFVGGLLGSLIAGDGLALKPSGIIGSLVGALIITGIWSYFDNQRSRAEREAAKAASRSGRHH